MPKRYNLSYKHLQTTSTSSRFWQFFLLKPSNQNPNYIYSGKIVWGHGLHWGKGGFLPLVSAFSCGFNFFLSYWQIRLGWCRWQIVTSFTLMWPLLQSCEKKGWTEKQGSLLSCSSLFWRSVMVIRCVSWLKKNIFRKSRWNKPFLQVYWFRWGEVNI